MNNAKYTFMFSSFPNTMVSSDRLTKEIQNSLITIALDHIDTSANSCDVLFKSFLSESEVNILNTIVSSHTGVPLPDNTIMPVKLIGPLGELQQNDDKYLLIAAEPRSGNEFITVTHNFCDPVTWFKESIRVNDEQLIDIGDGYSFNSIHTLWIDLMTGRIRGDDDVSLEQKKLEPLDPHGYLPIIKIDNIEKIICPIFSKTGGDYWINYEDGYVVFLESQTGKKVTASYSYAAGSSFVIEPKSGYMLDIEYAEADFSGDVAMGDTIQYVIYGYVDVFAPELMPGISSGTQISIISNKYKRYSQILSEAVGSFPTLLPNGSKIIDRELNYGEFRRISRGVRMNSVSIPFRYGTKRTLYSSAGMKLVISLENNIPFEGEAATITFFGTAKIEES